MAANYDPDDVKQLIRRVWWLARYGHQSFLEIYMTMSADEVEFGIKTLQEFLKHEFPDPAG